MLDQKNGRLGIRMQKEKIKQYNEMCEQLNSLPSKRIRKFIDLEMKTFKNGKDLLKVLEKI